MTAIDIAKACAARLKAGEDWVELICPSPEDGPILIDGPDSPQGTVSYRINGGTALVCLFDCWEVLAWYSATDQIEIRNIPPLAH